MGVATSELQVLAPLLSQARLSRGSAVVRADITAAGVLNAIAEHDRLGRTAFLERYGFNGARDYFLMHEGRSYDSKAIAAVAHKWAPDGDGNPLTALELSGGRADAAKRLTDLGFTVTTPGQDADWSWEEHVLALDLYMSNPASPPRKESSEVRELSTLLARLGVQSGVAMSDRYRNANGVYMKMMNFRRLDPSFQSQGKSGLRQGSKVEEEVWRRFADDRGGLRRAALTIKDRIERSEPSGAHVATDHRLVVKPDLFDAAWARFNRLIAAHDKDRPFTRFDEGLAAAWENYKLRLREHALTILAAPEWREAEIGSGAILERVIAAVEIQNPRINLVNNLVFWQDRYGHENRDHKALLEGRADHRLSRALEQTLFDLFHGGTNEAGAFDRLSELTGGKYPLLAYLFFLKDSDRLMPIQPSTFDQAFRELGIDLVTLRHCAWENYSRYNTALGSVRDALADRAPADVRLVDAHSFCWMLAKLPEIGDQRGRASSGNVGRIIGGREKAIIAMRYSIEQTVSGANGQPVQRTVKNKELTMTSAELERLLGTLFDMQGGRCALTGIPFELDYKLGDRTLLPSPDRIDSSKHYELGNLQIVCRFINFWKRDSENDEFKRLLKLVQGLEEPSRQ